MRRSPLATRRTLEATYLDIALRVADALGDPALGHIPDVLLHIPTAAFRRASEGGAAQALREHPAGAALMLTYSRGFAEGATRRILYRHPATPMVSIIIPTRNCLELLRPCVASLFEQTSYPEWELLLVDNGSDAPAVIDYYNELRSQHPGRQAAAFRRPVQLLGDEQHGRPPGSRRVPAAPQQRYSNGLTTTGSMR